MQKIVVADDHAAIRELVDLVLRKQGLEVLHATNGEQALALVEREQPALLILDIMMPGTYDGFAVLRELKYLSSRRRLPVLVLSACDKKEQRDLAISLGAQQYLNKPFQLNTLVQVVQSMLAGPA